MSLRQLVEGDCGGVNPLMQLGGQFTADAAYKDQGISHHAPFESRATRPEDQLVNEFLGQIAGPPQSFQMNSLLQEMREIEARNFQPQVQPAPRVIEEVTKSANWAKEFSSEMGAVGGAAVGYENAQQPTQDFNKFWDDYKMIQMQPVRNVVYAHEFFDLNENNMNNNYVPPMAICPPNVPPTQHAQAELNRQQEQMRTTENSTEDWLNDFQKSAEEEAKKTEDYNSKFWQKLQDEWQKLADGGDAEHPWLSEFSYDPYQEYHFSEQNPMEGIENCLQKGKEFLAQGDIPSAVLCFEVAVKTDAQNAEAWELLGVSQAENEMDPYAIAALKKSLELQPDNPKVMMALAVSYTNESLQSQALKMLTNWLNCHPKYKHLVPSHLLQSGEGTMASSLIRGPELKEIQNLFLEAVKQNPGELDADIQEALGVLFNLSSEYDKAVDCFQAALHVRPTNAKVWNRLGASLANGNRSVEAVEAYQRALQIEPGFIRVRYNVGICCMNLKAYKEAAEHLLTALNLQANSISRSNLGGSYVSSGTVQMSDTIWSTLKMVISLMGRSDLHDSINRRDLNTLNQAFSDS